MKNFDLLPLGESKMQKVKSFAQMHQKYGGIAINVIKVDPTKKNALIQIIDSRNEFNPIELVKRGREVFTEEISKEIQIYYTTMTEDSEYFISWDKKLLIKADETFFIWQIKHKAERHRIYSDIEEQMFPESTSKVELQNARSWFNNYQIAHPDEFPTIDVI
jgi:hypothetical protein